MELLIVLMDSNWWYYREYCEYWLEVEFQQHVDFKCVGEIMNNIQFVIFNDLKSSYHALLGIGRHVISSYHALLGIGDI